MTSAAADEHAGDDAEQRSSGIVLMKPAAQPASLLPNAFDRNQTPIISPRMRTGASLVTALRPTGLRHSSPSSEMRVGDNQPPSG